MGGYGVVAPFYVARKHKQDESDLIYNSFILGLVYAAGAVLLLVNATFTLTFYSYSLMVSTARVGYVASIGSFLIFGLYYIRLRHQARMRGRLAPTSSKEASQLPQITLLPHTDLRGFPTSFIVKFDFEIRSEVKIGALKVHVGVGYGTASHLVLLDLREYQTTEVQPGKHGSPVEEISFLSHDRRQFTFITFFFLAKDKIEKTATIRIVDAGTQPEFQGMIFASPYPIIHAKFSGLPTNVEKRYLVVYNEPPWIDSNNGTITNLPVELLDADADRAKQLMRKYEVAKRTSRPANKV